MFSTLCFNNNKTNRAEGLTVIKNDFTPSELRHARSEERRVGKEC